MYKTVWLVINEEAEFTIRLECYHFGKAPYFPCRFIDDENEYTINKIWNFKLIKTLPIFIKCLIHHYTLIREETT